MQSLIRESISYLDRCQLRELAHMSTFARNIVDEWLRAHPWTISPVEDAIDRSSLTILSRCHLRDRLIRDISMHGDKSRIAGDLLMCACRYDDIELMKFIIGEMRQLDTPYPCGLGAEYTTIRNLLFLSMPTRTHEWEHNIGREPVPVIYTYYQNKTLCASILRYVMIKYDSLFSKEFAIVTTTSRSDRDKSAMIHQFIRDVMGYIYNCSVLTGNANLARALIDMEFHTNLTTIINSYLRNLMRCMDPILVASMTDGYSNTIMFDQPHIDDIIITLGAHVDVQYILEQPPHGQWIYIIDLLINYHREDLARAYMCKKSTIFGLPILSKFVNHAMVCNVPIIRAPSFAKTIQFIANILLEDNSDIPHQNKESVMLTLLEASYINMIPVRTLKRVLNTAQFDAFGRALICAQHARRYIMQIDPKYEEIYDRLSMRGDGTNPDLANHITEVILTRINPGIDFGINYTIINAIIDLTRDCASGYVSPLRILSCLTSPVREYGYGSNHVFQSDVYRNVADECARIVHSNARLDHLSARDRFILGVILLDATMIKESGYALDTRKLIDQRAFDLMMQLCDMIPIDTSMIAHLAVSRSDQSTLVRMNDYAREAKLFAVLSSSDLRKVIDRIKTKDVCDIRHNIVDEINRVLSLREKDHA